MLAKKLVKSNTLKVVENIDIAENFNRSGKHLIPAFYPKIDKLLVKTKHGWECYPVNKLMYLEAKYNYTRLFFQDDIELVVSKNLKVFEDRLLELLFVRVSRKTLVNVSYVQKFLLAGYLELQNGTCIKISKSKKNEIMTTLSEMFY